MTTNPGNNQDITSLITALLGSGQQGIAGLGGSVSPKSWGDQGMKSGGNVKHFDDGGATLADMSGVSDLGLGDFTMPDVGGGGVSIPDMSSINAQPDLSALNGDLGLGNLNLSALMGSKKVGSLAPNLDSQLADIMNQAYDTTSSGDGTSLNLNDIFSGNNTNPDLSSLISNATSTENGYQIPANVTATAATDPLTGLTDAETQAQQDRVNAFTQGLSNNGVQDFGTGAITPDNLSSYQDTLSNIMNTGGGFTSGFQTVGDNKIIIHDDGTATGINTVSGQTFTLPASTVDTMVKTGVLNTGSSGYNTATGGTDTKPGGSGPSTTNTSTTPSTKTSTTPTNQPAAKDSTSSILALLALMALMDKGGSGGSNMSIPLFNAQRGVIPGSVTYTKAAGGGMMGGGISSLDGHLGGYSDGGRLLKGPGDGVSDDIPATIGGKEPARLADGEFVVPARIVSELGNGSTDAGARKLYAMMDRVQKDRSKAKDIAADTKADKHLPA